MRHEKLQARGEVQRMRLLPSSPYKGKEEDVIIITFFFYQQAKMNSLFVYD